MSERWGAPAADHAFVEPEPRLDVRTARELMLTPDPPAEYTLLGPYVYRGARTIIVGDTGHGKTSLALQMIGAILTGSETLGQQGAGVGPALVVDLEQGLRSIKRGLREVHLDDHDDLLYVSAPDGLALDQDPAHLTALHTALEEHQPSVLLLDPFYKAHRADDPNAERPIIDLMRQLDALRAVFQFALILPAHPRKDIGGREGARKLTIHDVAGSGAVTRGAEIVLGVERLGHGYARLRYLKDRDGDLPVGDAVAMLYSKDDGFRLDPREEESDEAIQARILATQFDWKTTREVAVDVGSRHARVKTLLESLAASEQIAFMVGPPGRSSKARCYSTAPEARNTAGTLSQSRLDFDCSHSHPPVRGWEQSVSPRGTVPPSEPEPWTDDRDDEWDGPF